MPGTPAVPGTPCGPGAPCTPGVPAGPGAPCGPYKPGAPLKPAAPGDPLNPGMPGIPASPSCRARPAQPGRARFPMRERVSASKDGAAYPARRSRRPLHAHGAPAALASDPADSAVRAVPPMLSWQPCGAREPPAALHSVVPLHPDGPALPGHSRVALISCLALIAAWPHWSLVPGEPALANGASWPDDSLRQAYATVSLRPFRALATAHSGLDALDGRAPVRGGPAVHARRCIRGALFRLRRRFLPRALSGLGIQACPRHLRPPPHQLHPPGQANPSPLARRAACSPLRDGSGFGFPVGAQPRHLRDAHRLAGSRRNSDAQWALKGSDPFAPISPIGPLGPIGPGLPSNPFRPRGPG
jgi:hypothetical protein